MLLACAISVSGVPSQTIRPPASPPSGPRSTIQSALAMTSRLCSITTSEWPSSTSRANALKSLSMSSKCKPVVGSSNRNNVPPGALAAAPSRFVSRFAREPAA